MGSILFFYSFYLCEIFFHLFLSEKKSVSLSVVDSIQAVQSHGCDKNEHFHTHILLISVNMMKIIMKIFP